MSSLKEEEKREWGGGFDVVKGFLGFEQVEKLRLRLDFVGVRRREWSAIGYDGWMMKDQEILVSYARRAPSKSGPHSLMSG